MDRFRRIRSKSTGPSDRSSCRSFAFSNPAYQEGVKQTQNPKSFPNLASGSSSLSNGIPIDEQLSLKWRSHSFTEETAGGPMKKLLAEVMVDETECKQRQPNIIARLMGLDGFPSQPSVHKPKKGFTENYHCRSASVESHRNAISYEGCYPWKSSKELKEFKDVFEVIDVPKLGSLQGARNAKGNEAKIELIRQKFIDAKRLSADERLQDSKEFLDTIEVLDSNADLLMKILPENETSYRKGFHDQKGSCQQSHSQCTKNAHIRSANALKCKKQVEGSKQGRQSSQKGTRCYPQNHGRLSQPYIRHDAPSPLKSRNQLKKDVTPYLPTEIVVLKPNVGKSPNATKSVISPHTSYALLSDCLDDSESLNIRHNFKPREFWEKENFYNDMGPLSCKSRASKDIDMDVMRQSRNGFTCSFINMSPSHRGGYAGDESSCCLSENDFANDSDAATLASKYSFDCSNPYQSLPSHSTRSSVSREARKRLSERWKMSQKCLDADMVNRGSTLGEMLSMGDREMLTANLNTIIGSKDWSDNGKISRRDGPLGIRSRDGFMGNLSKPKSVTTSFGAFGSSMASLELEAMGYDRNMMSNEGINKGRNRKAQISCGSMTHGDNKSRPHLSFREINGNLADFYYGKDQVLNNFEEKASSAQEPAETVISTSIVAGTESDFSDVLDAGHENTTTPTEFPDNFLQDVSGCVEVKVTSSHGVNESVMEKLSSRLSEEGSVVLCCPVAEPDYPASPKEADQPSPVSILEVPSVEDPSSGSECFERVSADLQGLRMQLQLLKLESESYVEGPMLVSSDEDDAVLEEKGTSGANESWKSSYLFDVLNQLDLDDTDPDTFMASWNSVDCPISPVVFEKLESKYCSQSTCLRSERKLVFDSINSGVVEICQVFMRPWVNSSPRKVHTKWGRVQMEHMLLTVLESGEKEGVCSGVVKVPAEWLNVGVEVDVIGKEVEKLLIDELIEDVVFLW